MSCLEMGFEDWWKKSNIEAQVPTKPEIPPEMLSAIKELCKAAWISARMPVDSFK
jgi:hypothetical protein